MNKIAIIVERQSGVFYHRLQIPYSLLHREGKAIVEELNGIDPANVGFIAKQKYDAVVFNRALYPHNVQAETIAKLKRLGVLVVCDIDDYWQLPPDHISAMSWQRTGLTKAIIEAMQLADVITTTHERLAKKIREVVGKEKKIIIAANAIDYNDPQFAPLKFNPQSPLIFGYQASAAHSHEFEEMSKGIKQYIKRHENGTVIIAGYSEEYDKLWQNYRSKLTPLGHDKRVQLRQGAPLNLYGNLMNDFTACLIPIADIEFNKYKSNLKLLECAAKGLPAIVTQRDPYREDAQFAYTYAVASTNNFDKMMQSVAKNRPEAWEMGQKLRRVMREKYYLPTEAEKRLKIF